MQYEDSFAKFLRISAYTISILLGLIVVIAGLFFVTGSYVMGVADKYAWFVYGYIIFIIGVPSFVFLLGYPVFFKRTRKHRFAWVRIISYTLFILGIIACIAYWVWDIYILFSLKDTNLADKIHTLSTYPSFSILFIGSNIACFFLVGVLQALTNEKEKDWMHRQNIKSSSTT
jgi:TRAP-type mannitol/chloroaromatic compound transport system permease small subunit